MIAVVCGLSFIATGITDAQPPSDQDSSYRIDGRPEGPGTEDWLSIESPGDGPFDSGSGQTYYVAPDGDDDSAGTRADPWGTVQASVSRLDGGDTLVLRGGRYRESEIVVEQPEDAGPITLRAAEGETPIITGYIDAFRNPDSEPWEAVDREEAHWRSKERYKGPLSGKLETSPRLSCTDGRPIGERGYVGLIPYMTRQAHSFRGYDPVEMGYDNLTARTGTVTEDRPHYAGPGLTYRKNTPDEPRRIHLRLKPPYKESLHGRKFDIPENADPNEQSLRISNKLEGLILKGTRDVRIEGIRIAGFDRPITLDRVKRIELKDLELLGGKHGIWFQTAEHVRIDGCTFELNTPPWLAWHELKGSGRNIARKSGITMGLWFVARTNNVEVTDCEFYGVFDGLNTGYPISRIRVVNNYFDVRDDGFEIPTGADQIEVAYNVFRGPGPANDERREEYGETWIHHNVIDTSMKALWARADEGVFSDETNASIGWAPHKPMPGHGDAPPGGQTWKVYNNTILFGTNETRIGPWGTGSDIYHDVFNNIVHAVALDDMPDRVKPVYWTYVRTGRRMRLDGNLYGRDITDGWDRMFSVRDASGKRHWFDTLEEFRNSDLWEQTRDRYPPGWEAHGVEVHGLEFDSEYRPAIDRATATGGVDLSETGWPGVPEVPYRGAIPPDGEPVGPRRTCPAGE